MDHSSPLHTPGKHIYVSSSYYTVNIGKYCIFDLGLQIILFSVWFNLMLTFWTVARMETVQLKLISFKMVKVQHNIQYYNSPY